MAIINVQLIMKQTTRFFPSLRMTDAGIGEFFNTLLILERLLANQGYDFLERWGDHMV